MVPHGIAVFVLYKLSVFKFLRFEVRRRKQYYSRSVVAVRGVVHSVSYGGSASDVVSCDKEFYLRIFKHS